MNDHRMNDLIEFDVDTRSATLDNYKYKTIPTLAINGELKPTELKRSLSESSLHDIVIESKYVFFKYEKCIFSHLLNRRVT